MDDEIKLTVRKDAASVRIGFDDDGTPIYMGERLVELRPGYWVHPWNWELQLRQIEETVNAIPSPPEREAS